MGQIFVAADMHSDFAELERLMGQLGPEDTLVLAGDLVGMPWTELRALPPPVVLQRIHADYQRLARQVEPLDCFTVRGNWDPDIYYDYFGDRDLCGRLVERGGLTLTGYSEGVEQGSPVPMPEMWFETPSPAADPELLARAEVWISHVPPHGTLDDMPMREHDITLHVGDRGLAGLVHQLQPRALYCGHLHRPGEARVGPTRVVRAPLSVDAPVLVAEAAHDQGFE